MKQRSKRSLALVMALAMVFSFASLFGACGEKKQHTCEHVCEVCGKCTSDCADPACADKCEGHEVVTHECGHVCPTCGKCTDETCTDPVCADKCEGHEAAHECGHVCPECGKCLDETCTDPVCADKCEGHEQVPSKDGDFTPITTPVAGKYYMGMKCSGDVYYYLKGGMSGYYMATSSNKDDAVIVDLIADGDGWLLKQGNQYMEIEISGTHVNAVYKSAQTAGKRWTWDSTYNIFTWESGAYFYGTYGSYNTIGGGDYAQHASDNYKAQLGTFGDQAVVQPDPASVTLDKTGELYLSPNTGSYIQLTARVQPADAAQDIVWASSAEGVATVANGKVTCVAAGETTISATAKDTAIKAEVTVKVTEKGSPANPLSVDEAIELTDTAGEGVQLGDTNNKFYISGVVEEGSTLDGVGNAAAWTVNLLGTDSKKLQASINHNTYYYSLGQPTNVNGGLDNFTLVLGVSLTKSSSSYALSVLAVQSGTRPAVTGITIDATAKVNMPLATKINVTEIQPKNAELDGTEVWHTSAETTATVADGMVTGVEAGEVKIWVELGNVKSNECTVTVNAPAASKATFDWTNGAQIQTKKAEEVFTVDATQQENGEDVKEEYIDVWNPGQTEIKSFVINKYVKMGYNLGDSNPGFGCRPSIRTPQEMKIEITTEHRIKKVTLKVIPYSQDANTSNVEKTMVDITVNGKNHKDEVNDSWTGLLASAYEITFELDEASDTITITGAAEKGNNFAIVGMTLEW